MRGNLDATSLDRDENKTMTGWKTGLAVAVALMAAGAVFAPARADVLGTYKQWTAHSYTERGNEVCSMWSEPTKHEENNRPRGDIYAFVTHRLADDSLNEVSFEMGYPLQAASSVTVTIGKKSFEFITKGSGAYSYAADDNELIHAMRNGTTMTVQGTSVRGTKTRDTYSLLGFTNAYRAIGRACLGTEAAKKRQ